MKNLFFFFLILISQVGFSSTELHLYWTNTCPHCHEQLKDVNRLKTLYPGLEVKTFRLDNNKSNVKQLRRLTEIYNINFGNVPVSFLGHRVWVGFDQQTSHEIQKQIQECFSKNLDCRVKSGTLARKGNFNIYIPLLGEFDLENSSLLISTVLIGIADGFNPCSLWVLSLLMTMIIGTKSRKKIFIIGLSFLVTTAAIYAFFVTGILSFLQYVDQLKWIKIIVALLAFTFAIVNIKDYFWYKKGLSFTIPKKFQPVIYRNFRDIAHSQQSLTLLVMFTILIAGGIAVIEFPCTAGLPLVWGQLILKSGIAGIQYGSLLILYVFFYLLDELLVFLIFVKTLKVSQLQEKQGRFLKLLSGMIMLFLSIALVFFPEIMDQILTSLILIISATVISFVIHKLSRI